MSSITMPGSYEIYLGIFYMHYHIDIITDSTSFGESVVGTGGEIDNMLIEFHLSETNRLCWARTWTVCLTDGYVNHCAISPPLVMNELTATSERYSYIIGAREHGEKK